MDNPASTESPLHEGTQLNLRALIKFTIWFVIGTILVHLVIWWIFVLFRSAVGEETREITGVKAERLAPPEPRLQPSEAHNRLPAQDMAAMHAVEREEFARRGWIDEKTGQVRVPPAVVGQLSKLSEQRK